MGTRPMGYLGVLWGKPRAGDTTFPISELLSRPRCATMIRQALCPAKKWWCCCRESYSPHLDVSVEPMALALLRYHNNFEKYPASAICRPLLRRVENNEVGDVLWI